MDKVLLVFLRLLSCLLGVAIGGVGLFLGQSSHQVAYQPVNNAQIRDYISGNSDNNYTSYFDIAGTSALFIVHEHDFSPNMSFHAVSSGLVSFVYNTDDSSGVDVSSTDGLHLKGTGYRVIEVSGLNSSQTYVTSDYSSHPNGYYDNLWTVAYVVIGVGALILLLSLFFGEHMIVATATGAIGVPIAFFLFIGFFVGTGAFQDDLTIAAVLGIVGAIGGLVYGVFKGFTD